MLLNGILTVEFCDLMHVRNYLYFYCFYFIYTFQFYIVEFKEGVCPFDFNALERFICHSYDSDIINRPYCYVLILSSVPRSYIFHLFNGLYLLFFGQFIILF